MTLLGTTGVLVVLVVLAVLLVVVVTAGVLVARARRLDRLHVRTDAAAAALAAVLDRRAAVVRAIAATAGPVALTDPDRRALRAAARAVAATRAASDGGLDAEREAAESDLTRALGGVRLAGGRRGGRGRRRDGQDVRGGRVEARRGGRGRRLGVGRGAAVGGQRQLGGGGRLVQRVEAGEAVPRGGHGADGDRGDGQATAQRRRATPGGRRGAQASAGVDVTALRCLLGRPARLTGELARVGRQGTAAVTLRARGPCGGRSRAGTQADGTGGERSRCAPTGDQARGVATAAPTTGAEPGQTTGEAAEVGEARARRSAGQSRGETEGEEGRGRRAGGAVTRQDHPSRRSGSVAAARAGEALGNVRGRSVCRS